MNIRRFRRLGGVLLIMAMAPVATANALACGLECALAARDGHSAHHGAPALLLSGSGRSGPAVSASHFCPTLQPLSPTFVTPEFPAPPAVAGSVSVIVVPLVALPPSTVAEFDPPPPRA